MSTIKAIETQLSTLALHSHEEQAQQTFHEVMLVMGEVKKDLHDRKVEMELEEPQYKES